MTTVQVMTTGDLDAIVQHPENQERLFELVHGEVVEKVPTELHGKLAALIAHFLLAFILPRGIKAHVGVEVRHEVPHDQYNSRIPDVSLRLTDSEPVNSGAVPGFPDLAVEIQSPADRPHQMRQKALYYLQKGSQIVWLVYPESQQVELCTLDSAANLELVTLTIDDSLTAGEILPEFTLPVRDVFSNVTP